MHNPILSTDFYTACSDTFASENARQYSLYNLTNRISPKNTNWGVAKDSRMVFYGIRRFVEEYLTTKITKEHLDEAKAFMARGHSFGGAIPFNDTIWNRVIKENNGYLPIHIQAMPEGSVVFPFEPFIKVTAKDGYGELAAHVEARLVGLVSKSTAVATLLAHWKERIKEQIRLDLQMVYGKYTEHEVEEVAKWQIHNFGSRACASESESISSGLAHLLMFNGTDNTDAALMAWKYGCHNDQATSVIASAHRNCQAYNNDIDTVRAMARLPNVRIISCVSDCFNFFQAVDDIVQEAKDNPGIIYVPRPDSDDGLKCIKYIITTAIEQGVYKEHNGFPFPLNVRYIYGDSVSPAKQTHIDEKLRSQNIPSTLWGIKGVGGYIVNNCTRDTLSSAYKLADCESGPVVKLSETPDKLSVPGDTTILRPFYDYSVSLEQNKTLVNYYYPNGIVNTPEPFWKVSFRAKEEFDMNKEFATNNPDYGLKRTSLSPDIIDIQNRFYAKFRPDDKNSN